MAQQGASKDTWKCRLLSLPAEMENKIYRYTLTTPEDIEIRSAADLPVGPGLLRTCRQIRPEAIGIYYHENDFAFPIQNFNADCYIKFCKSSRNRLMSSHIFRIYEARTGSWPNLVRWLKAWWDYECRSLEPPEKERRQGDTLCCPLVRYRPSRS
ncbi:hypothetical protein CLAFUW4_14140 [Fulvia fulva]|uniref:Uncharacterized protein n=1 Tax=Passalora fulva TaxID=5499 RepID=A0A9Q8PLF3_PASFU|nr:uncharacterized protein CLAFUR5_13974 [Fulvia fulva]KAK4610579.1 hypothetical protein CLAFUR4_14143 [Fulvia fulva]KAK4610963.1 hypothetical protein CLAFUR0_14147 [Fulvia fulva]UJO24587.1 hypothetical protein CLAFUR5_13974 [Fulvia fulva]WPV21950.1 hypothetical protein CLAFUW4_14140 [Fulvia fulva]WPV37185.1 hypothetical protein CLAFUW7_14151 [Fulvia fulva]